MLSNTCQAYYNFWLKHPALLTGISLLMGSACYLSFQSYYLVVLAVLILPITKNLKLFCLAIIAILIGFVSILFRYPELTLASEKISGVGKFKPQLIKMVSSPFYRSLLYQGTLIDFQTKEQTYHNIPCSIYLPIYGKRPICNAIYEIEGNLQQKSSHLFVLKPTKKKTWKRVAPFLSLIEWRFSAKQLISKYIHKQVSDRKTAVFLSALVTGQIDERLLTMQFGKLGLQHLLVISGFHFALLAYLLKSMFNCLLPYKTTALTTLLCLSFYYVFLGDSPSIQRAYIAIATLLMGELIGYPSSGLNTIGLGLIVELYALPLNILELGFQLTFLCTLAILLLYQPTEHLLSYFLPKRTEKELKEMPLIDKYAYSILHLLRSSFSVNIAVHIATVPLLLYLFHQFPLLSIAYNLFFPYCAALSCILLFPSLILYFIPKACSFVFKINELFSTAILHITSYPPIKLQFSLRTDVITPNMLGLYLTVLFFGAIAFHEKASLQKASNPIF
ncbi:Competence protein [Candidatus Rhabdochlamydia oedothoracis]|uniref:Competence protein n=1 Tax=Candidatus Rhabdochlamydia oedothoracis TaxID=2720720 RepID=A0ABX8V6E3_9BACT|nr:MULTISPECIES: ComEC/Rec2 family competence protein [Rhabdochlamydia]KAG6559032.1 ComE operon protein 3 [Candidatus Rhabdochlamydia sp. W815]QYF49152.1 Competence protein [Candidatus Rhabdochlamydia oedothoracis]